MGADESPRYGSPAGSDWRIGSPVDASERASRGLFVAGAPADGETECPAQHPTGAVCALALPLALADFSRRGFRTDRPEARAELERHARSFLRGFNVAVTHWRDPHQVLAEFPEFERGFAYEGAAMHAALRDLSTFGWAGAFRRLLNGPGEKYIHLIHVGYGWSLVPLRIPLPVRKPSTPLLRWLALDGAGFAETYFGGVAALRRRCGRAPTDLWEARVAGCGRALWFAESSDVDGVADTIESTVAAARPHLWSGIGLACCYAGCAGEEQLGRLIAASGRHWPYFAQGAMFAAAARYRARAVPPHTARVCQYLFSTEASVVSAWTDEAACGLTDSVDVAAYTEWKSRLRRAAATHV
jgi:enediyne biosynthesis protein E3